MRRTIIPAILAGGSGTRFWPVSTDAAPKPFHAVRSAQTLLQETLVRVHANALFGPPIVVCDARHVGLVIEQCAGAGVDPAAIVCEPEPRNTAPACAAAALIAREIDAEALVLALPADHSVDKPAALLEAIALAAPHAETRIVTFGIRPERAETGYGYIKAGAALGEGVFAVDAFKEKPSAAVADAYLREGGYFWNAGMFLFRPEVLMDELAGADGIGEACTQAVADARRDGRVIWLERTAFARAARTPIDIAVMERTQRGALAPCDIGWADLGSWDEVWRTGDHDEAGNLVRGAVLAHEARNNLLRSDAQVLCVSGVEDLIVVATANAIVVTPRARAQDVKLLLEEAKKRPAST